MQLLYPIITYSHFLWATCATSKTSRAAQAHLLSCFAVMGTPKNLKTDNGPAYTNRSFFKFYSQFHIALKTGIPYNPQGQGIIKRAHLTLKNQIYKIKKGELEYKSPHSLLAHAIYILNFLQVDADGHSTAEKLWNPKPKSQPLVIWKDPLTGALNGPDPVLMWGRGYVCVFPTDADSPRWLPERCVRHAQKQNSSLTQKDDENVNNPSEEE